MLLTGENRSTWGKACPSDTLPTTNHKWTDPGANPWWNDAGKGKLLIVHQRALRQSTSSHLIVNQEKLNEGNLNLVFEASVFILQSYFLHAKNLTIWGQRLYLPSEGRCAADFYCP
jgi:hypothetical protein